MEDPKRCFDVLIELRDYANEVVGNLGFEAKIEMDNQQLTKLWEARVALQRIAESQDQRKGMATGGLKAGALQ